jgi:hypothetical protein
LSSVISHYDSPCLNLNPLNRPSETRIKQVLPDNLDLDTEQSVRILEHVNCHSIFRERAVNSLLHREQSFFFFLSALLYACLISRGFPFAILKLNCASDRKPCYL